MKYAVAFALPFVAFAAACSEETTGTDLELTCPPGPVHVGQTIQIVAHADLPYDEPPLEWVQLSEGGELMMPPVESQGSWQFSLGEGGLTYVRVIDLVATRPGRTTIGLEWTGPEDEVPLFPADSVTFCTYDIQAGEPPPPAGLEVTVRRAGAVVSEQGNFRCQETGFEITATEVCTAMFTGTAFLRADPDEAFGFSQTIWYGCDTADGNLCSVRDPNGRRVEACFHDGSTESIAACNSAQP